MKWLAGWDFSARVMPALPVWLSQIIFAILCAFGFVILRAAVDVFAPSAGPFALIYPFVLAATLFGRWQAGVIANILTILYIWFYILPVPGHLGLERNGDEPRMLVNIIAGAIIVCLAEIFRRAVADATAAREARIAERDLLLREIDHRVKNNFAAVTGLIQLQRQRATNDIVRDELGVALSRVESFATAHRFLYRDGAALASVDMQPYLEQLSDALSAGLLRSDNVRIVCIAEAIDMPRDRAVSIGLIVNELVTNAAKHAFPDDRGGRILILFQRVDGAIELIVEDDGCGGADRPRDGSLGRRLIAGFVQQAAGELSTRSSPEGTTCRVRLQ
jgi:two-component sensor histidine kinase